MFSSLRFGAAEYGVGNLQRGFHVLMLPYLWDEVKHAAQSE
jgi:hypothetical protein